MRPDGADVADVALDVARSQRIERDEFLRVVALSAQAAQAFAGRKDEPEDLGPPVYPDRYAPGARVWGFRAVECAVTIESSLALAQPATDAERAMTVDEWDTLRALCAMQAAAEAQHATDARARGSRSVTAEHDAKRYSALAVKCEARMSALRAGRVMP
jgi:hypothetical protein